MKEPKKLTAFYSALLAKFGSVKAASEAFGLSYTQMLKYVHGESEMSVLFVKKAVKLLGIEGNSGEVYRIFICD